MTHSLFESLTADLPDDDRAALEQAIARALDDQLVEARAAEPPRRRPRRSRRAGVDETRSA